MRNIQKTTVIARWCIVVFCLGILSCNNTKTTDTSTSQAIEVIDKIEPPAKQVPTSVSLETEQKKMKPLEKKTIPSKGAKPTTTSDKTPQTKPASQKPAPQKPKSTTSAPLSKPQKPVATPPPSSTTPPTATNSSPPKATLTTSPTTQPSINMPVILPPEPDPVVNTSPPPAPKKPTLSHAKWDQLAGKYISSRGKVDYAGIKQNKVLLNQYIAVLQNNPPQSNWSRNKTMAFWINAYNAFTVKLIVDNYPTTSITKLEGGDPWKKNWIKIGISTYSLNQIEKDLLIKKFNEPRVHFAVNCAAKSCPPILNKAWTADNLEANFERSTKNFINDPSFNDISNPKKIQISKIFEWYAADFGNNVIGFINKYATVPVKENANVSYQDYNWALNN